MEDEWIEKLLKFVLLLSVVTYVGILIFSAIYGLIRLFS